MAKKTFLMFAEAINNKYWMLTGGSRTGSGALLEQTLISPDPPPAVGELSDDQEAASVSTTQSSSASRPAEAQRIK